MKALQPKVILIDDGTLDTVLMVENETYRFTIDGEWKSYDDFLEWCKVEALDAYFSEMGEK